MRKLLFIVLGVFGIEAAVVGAASWNPHDLFVKEIRSPRDHKDVFRPEVPASVYRHLEASQWAITYDKDPSRCTTGHLFPALADGTKAGDLSMYRFPEDFWYTHFGAAGGKETYSLDWNSVDVPVERMFIRPAIKDAAGKVIAPEVYQTRFKVVGGNEIYVLSDMTQANVVGFGDRLKQLADGRLSVYADNENFTFDPMNGVLSCTPKFVETNGKDKSLKFKTGGVEYRIKLEPVK